MTKTQLTEVSMHPSRLFMAFFAVAWFVVWPGSARAADSTNPAIDVSLVTPHDFMAIVIHPRQIARLPLVTEFLQEEMIAAAIKKLGIEPTEVEQIVVLGRMNAKVSAEPSILVSARFTHEVNAKEVLSKFSRGTPVEEIKVRGKTCFRVMNPFAPMAYAPDKNTVVLAGQEVEVMKDIVDAGEPKGPLLERLKNADVNSEIVVVVEPGTIANLATILDAIKKNAPPLVGTYLDAAKTVRGGTANFSLHGPTLLSVVFDAKDAGSADNLEELLQQSLRMAGAGLVVAKQTMPKDMRSTLDPLLKLADELVDGGKAAKSGSRVTLDFQRPKDLDTAGAAIAGALGKSIVEARSAARRTQQMNNMKQVTLAMLMYEQIHQSFPPAVIEKDGKPLLSWRVAILPFLEEDVLYKQFHLDEAWNSPHNLAVAKKMPAVFQSPESPKTGKTRVMLFTGKGAAFDGGKKIAVADIRDGMSNTILCVEAGADKAVPWTKPEDLPFDEEKPLATLGTISPQGLIAAFFDGHVEQLKVDNKTLKALITPDGNEVIDLEKMRGGR
jgi:hypothetical protein